MFPSQDGKLNRGKNEQSCEGLPFTWRTAIASRTAFLDRQGFVARLFGHRLNMRSVERIEKMRYMEAEGRWQPLLQSPTTGPRTLGEFAMFSCY